MSYLFFLSYAREDNNTDGLVKKFYEDLSRDIAGKIAASPKQFCGKEWAVFKSRVEAYAKGLPKGSEFPALMFPVLWQKETYVLERLPAPLSKIQYKFDDYGKAYAEQGLRVMLRNKKFRQQYDDFVPVLADQIIEAAQRHKLPALPNLPALDQIAGTFPAGTAAPEQIAEKQVAGANPRYVKFIFLAGRKQELQPVRASLESYGEESGGEWKPWLPDPKDEVDRLVQDVIHRENFVSEGAIALDDDLEKRLEEAENTNKIVVIVVDMWTLQLANYRKLMHDVVDPKQLVNCVIVVPWNPQDAEAVNQRQKLETLLQATFVKHTANESPDLLTQIDSATKLKDRLAAMLQVTKSKIIRRAEVQRKAVGAEAIALSNIEGPGGN
jgi:FxsC-like protein